MQSKSFPCIIYDDFPKAIKLSRGDETDFACLPSATYMNQNLSVEFESSLNFRRKALEMF